MNQIGFNTVEVQGKKIVDVKSDNHFGLLLTTQKQIEDFQTKSGMMKKYISEYQYHYWALVGRVRIESDVLDIAIPTAVFNYKQTVSSGAVGFHLNDVETASKASQEIAQAKAMEIINGQLGQRIASLLPIIEWVLVPFNTCHVHPGQLTTFSGTDYAKTIGDPGIVYPLDEPKEQASFSSILCHSKDNSARMVRTEYRFANFEDGNNVYHHGACVQYVKGYKTESIESFSPIKQMFFGESKTKVHEVEDYHMKDRCSDADLTGSFVEQIVEIFKECDYEPDTSMVFETNIVKEIFTRVNYYPANPYGSKKFKTKDTAVNSLLDYQVDDRFEEMRDKLVEEGYQRSQVMSWGYDTLIKFYDRVMEEEIKRIMFEEDDGFSVYEYKTDKKAIEFLLANGYSEGSINSMSEESIEMILLQFGY